jgi:hypothetical protein
MLNLLARVYRKFGLVAVHVTVVREKHGSMRVTESKFPSDSPIDVRTPIIYLRGDFESLHTLLGRYTPLYSLWMPHTELQLLSRSQGCSLNLRPVGLCNKRYDCSFDKSSYRYTMSNLTEISIYWDSLKKHSTTELMPLIGDIARNFDIQNSMQT